MSNPKKVLGNPATLFGKLNTKWRDANLVRMGFPYEMRIAWNTKAIVDDTLVHRMVADSLKAALREIWDTVRWDMKKRHGFGHQTVDYDAWTMDEIRRQGLDLFGGVFNFRKVRGGSGLSMHAYGAAFDLDPAHNKLGTPGVMPEWVVQIFARHNFAWGGEFKRKDPMHFEWKC